MADLGPYGSAILESAYFYDLDPFLIRAIVITESSENPNARGAAGEIGLMQLMPSTAQDLGVSESELYTPWVNIDTGSRYLKQQFDKFGDIQTAIMAYNAGPGRVSSGNVPQSTVNYLNKVIAKWQELGGSPQMPQMGEIQVTVDWIPLIVVSLIVLAGTLYIRGQLEI